MKKKLTSIILVLCLAVGCSTSWVDQALKITAVVLPSALNVLQLVAVFRGVPMNQSAAATVTNDFNVITTDLKDYQAASAAAGPAILSQLNAALNTTQSHLDSLFVISDIKDAKKQAEVKAVVALVISELASIQALIPQNGATTHANVRPLDAKHFKKAFNGIMREADPSLMLK